MPLTSRKLLLGVAGIIGFGGLGALLLIGAYDSWLQQEMTLGRNRFAPRLITYATDPTEFVLRCVFMAALGAFFLSSGCVGALGLLLRLLTLGRSFMAGPFESSIVKLLMLLPLAFFALWAVLLVFLPAYYD